jgi:hypothetical protein
VYDDKSLRSYLLAVRTLGCSKKYLGKTIRHHSRANAFTSIICLSATHGSARHTKSQDWWKDLLRLDARERTKGLSNTDADP